MEDTYGATVYFVVSADWMYNEEDVTTGEVCITIKWYENYPPE